MVAYVDHEVVQGLRDGMVTGGRFGRVIEVGHSAGSGTVWQEAITYDDVDGLIITGLVHHIAVFQSSTFADDIYPAGDDPKFAGTVWAPSDPGYLTTLPGTRGTLFYSAFDSDPAVVAADDNATRFGAESFADEQGKDVVPAGEFDGQALVTSTATTAIRVPVLIILGSDDQLLCGPDAQGVAFDCSSGHVIAEQERPYYSPAADLEACSVPESGHSISLQFGYWIQQLASIDWSAHFVGQRGDRGPDVLPAQCRASGSG